MSVSLIQMYDKLYHECCPSRNAGNIFVDIHGIIILNVCLPRCMPQGLQKEDCLKRSIFRQFQKIASEHAYGFS